MFCLCCCGMQELPGRLMRQLRACPNCRKNLTLRTTILCRRSRSACECESGGSRWIAGRAPGNSACVCARHTISAVFSPANDFPNCQYLIPQVLTVRTFCRGRYTNSTQCQTVYACASNVIGHLTMGCCILISIRQRMPTCSPFQKMWRQRRLGKNLTSTTFKPKREK